MVLPAAIDPNRKFHLDRDGFGLPTLLMDIMQHDPELGIRLRNKFCELFPQFKTFHVPFENAFRRTYVEGTAVVPGTGLGAAIVFETHSGHRDPRTAGF